jgi:Putative Actinobacterial Holin-X, holin superfamily III
MAMEKPTPNIEGRPSVNRAGDARESQSTAGLFRQLFDEVSTLFRKEIALAKAELSEAVSEAKLAAISMASGGAVLFAGGLVLLAAAVLALAHVVPDWLAALIVGGIVAVIGFVMIQAGKKKLEPSALKPERTQDALRKDKEMVQRRMP